MVLQNVEDRALQHQCRGHGFKSHRSPGGRVLPYITYMGMCRPTGRDFEAPDLERGIHLRGVF